jgi:hypothetical protein
MKAKRFWIAINMLLVAALACNLPAGAAAGTPTLPATPATPATETPTPAPALPATATITASPSVPLVSVSTATNCRTGPGTSFDIVITLNPGTKAEVIGKNTGLNYWIIKVPGGSGQCWLWGNYATLEGNIAALPEYPSPPTPTPSLPAPVTNLNGELECNFETDPFWHTAVEVELHWNDVATNEDSYRIFRDGTLLDTIDANSTSFDDETTFPALYEIDNPPSVTYEVQASNSAGKSDKKSVTLYCP